ncbi:hypothetical protein AB0442_38480 [Kitasatospora sp. NPDC085895]|uniref:nucleotide-binding protein n=1 Tax=Kitasatospora sp. NPDC085895 TaxID=3155057 RepID=UPI00344E49E9
MIHPIPGEQREKSLAHITPALRRKPARPAECTARQVTEGQGSGRAVDLWLEDHPSPHTAGRSAGTADPGGDRKGGVGKTFVSGGPVQAAAEHGKRVLLVGHDPQGHLTARPGPEGSKDSPPTPVPGRSEQQLRELLTVLDEGWSGGRPHVLSACGHAFPSDAAPAVTRHGRDSCPGPAPEQTEDLCGVVTVDQPGPAVNAHDARREATVVKNHAPDSDPAETMRDLALELIP